MEKPGTINLFKFTPDFVSTFPVQVFAFTCSQNVGRVRRCHVVSEYVSQLFAIHNELKSNTQARMNIVIGTSIGGAAIIYEIIAVFGYLTFGSKVCPIGSPRFS